MVRRVLHVWEPLSGLAQDFKLRDGGHGQGAKVGGGTPDVVEDPPEVCGVVGERRLLPLHAVVR
jgi:hypothetical protein